MSFRRIPFQFETTDPVERQRELERRFGLPSNRDMFVDVVNPLSMGTMPRDSSLSSGSPRLQHRVPIFVEGHDHPINTSVDSSGVASENKKPNVRVIPIEVEGAETRPATRHRTFSGPVGVAKEQNNSFIPPTNKTSPLKHSMTDLSGPKSSTLPRVHNIPIQVEGACNTKSPKLEKAAKSPKFNGCTITKPKVKSPEKSHGKKAEPPKVENEAKKQENAIQSALKKIENVLEELKSYEAGVQEFSGTTKEKQYRYLDEMLTRCMLKMDEIDTMGNDNLRSARKDAIKKIQACIDLLESKANAVTGDLTSSQNKVETSEETAKPSTENNENACLNDVEMTETQIVEQETSKNSLESNGESALQEPCKMIGDQTENVSTVSVGNCDASLNEKGDIEMKENQSEEPAACESKTSSEVVSSQDNGTIANEVPEVEMADIKSASSQNLASEIPEVEMADSVQNGISDSTIQTEEEKLVEVKSLELASDVVSQEDIEMKDVQNTLNDIKETVAEEKSVISTSSQPEEKTESDVNAEVICSKDAHKM